MTSTRRIIVYKDSTTSFDALINYMNRFKARNYAYSIVFADPTNVSYYKGIYDHGTLMQKLDDMDWVEKVFIIMYSNWELTIPASRKMIYPIDTLTYEDDLVFFSSAIESPIFIIGNPIYTISGPRVIDISEDMDVQTELLKMPITKVECFFSDPVNFVCKHCSTLGEEALVIGIGSKHNNVEIYNEENFTTITSGLKVYWAQIQYNDDLDYGDSQSIAETEQELGVQDELENVTKDISIEDDIKLEDKTTFVLIRDIYNIEIEAGSLLQVYYEDGNEEPYTENYILCSESDDGRKLGVKSALTLSPVQKDIKTDVLTHSTIFTVTLGEN